MAWLHLKCRQACQLSKARTPEWAADWSAAINDVSMRHLSTATWMSTIRSLQCMFPNTPTGRDTLHALVCRMHTIRKAHSAPSRLPALLAHLSLRPAIAPTERALACMLPMKRHLEASDVRAVTSWTRVEPHSSVGKATDKVRDAAYLADLDPNSDGTLGQLVPSTSAELALRPLRAACLRFSDFANPLQVSCSGSHAGLSDRDELLIGMERAALYGMDTYSADLAHGRLQQSDTRDHFRASLLTLATLSVLQDHRSIKTVADYPVDIDVRSLLRITLHALFY
jgi:hypothetical protein